MTASARLRSSSSSRDRARRAARASPAIESAGASRGSIGAAGLLDRRRARSASPRARVNAARSPASGSGARRGRRRPRRAGRASPRRTSTSRSTSPATPRPPSTSWQKPWVVAIVAASKSASARASRVAARLDLLARARRRAAARPRRVAARARERAASSRSAATSRSRTRSRSSPVAIRVNVTSSSCVERRALGDVARRQRGDRVRLAGAGARLEHGDAGRQRPADVERRGSPVAHLLARQQPVPQPPRERPKRDGSPGSQRSSSRGRGSPAASSNGARAAEHEQVLGRRGPPSAKSSRTPTRARARVAPPRRAYAAEVWQASGSGSRIPRS